MLETEFIKPSGLTIYQSFETEALNEALKFRLGDGALGEIDEVGSDAPLREEANGLSRIRAFLQPKYLNFHLAGS